MYPANLGDELGFECLSCGTEMDEQSVLHRHSVLHDGGEEVRSVIQCPQWKVLLQHCLWILMEQCSNVLSVSECEVSAPRTDLTTLRAFLLAKCTMDALPIAFARSTN